MPSYPDNSIIISFDQQCAVRKRDGLRLVAASEPNGMGNRCSGCEAGTFPSGSHWSCLTSRASDPKIRCCNGVARKDGRNIIWRPA